MRGMYLEIPSLRIFRRTIIDMTFIRFRSRMNKTMSLQIPLLRKSLITIRTHIWFFTSMFASMSLHPSAFIAVNKGGRGGEYLEIAFL